MHSNLQQILKYRKVMRMKLDLMEIILEIIYLKNKKWDIFNKF